MTDLVTDLLHGLRLHARVFHRGQHCGAWVIPIEGKDSAIFHLVTHGSLSVETRHCSEAIDVEAGDLVLFRQGRPHTLRGLDPSGTGLVCGRFEFHEGTVNPLLESLPDVLVVPARSHPEEQWLRSLVRLIVWESTHTSAASEAVMGRLAEALFIHALRSHLRENPASTGLLGAFGDPALRPVLEEMRRDPTRPWSVSAMAAVSRLSRSAFIGRFTRVLGVAPATYLKRLRLERGHRLLAESRNKVLDIALACGYASEAAFSKAFKREYGVPPSQLRKRRALAAEAGA
jgi:AraC family transcriptional regulator, activator of mtrCDE